MSEKDAYFAGLMDGEGSWSIQVKGARSPNPRMTMTLKYGGEVLYELAEHYGGAVYIAKDGQMRWSLGRQDAMRAATASMMPYLRIKREVAQRFLSALDEWPVKGVNGRAQSGSWTPSLIERIALLSTQINAH